MGVAREWGRGRGQGQLMVVAWGCLQMAGGSASGGFCAQYGFGEER